MCEPVKVEIDLYMMDEIYIALKDSYERLDNGKMLLKRCINYLENGKGSIPPKGSDKEK